jgi:hypothetical protein
VTPVLWPAIITGIVVIPAGVLLVIFRRQATRANAAVLKAVLGGAGAALSRRAPPWSIAAVGVFAIGFGVVSIILGIRFYQ